MPGFLHGDGYHQIQSLFHIIRHLVVLQGHIHVGVEGITDDNEFKGITVLLKVL